jgi:hypothetical protein
VPREAAWFGWRNVRRIDQRPIVFGVETIGYSTSEET